MPHEVHLVCAFVESQPIGASFTASQWPLHATVVPWFRLQSSEAVFADALQQVLDQEPSFTAHVTTDSLTRYGARKVSLLQPEEWQSVHETALAVVTQHAGTLATKVFIGPKYRPHVTFQKAGHLQAGDQFVCDSLYIVRRVGKHRQVTHKLRLSDED